MSGTITIPALLSALAVLSWCFRKVSFPPWMETAQKVGSWGAGKDELVTLGNRLQALRLPISPELFAALRMLITYLPILVAIVLIAGGNIKAVSLFLAIPFMKKLAPMILTVLEKRRKMELLRDFPLMLDQIKIYAKAAGYYQALKVVAKSMKGELGKELSLLSAEMELMGVIKAVNNFADRCGISEFKDFARIIAVEETTGADISQTLLNYSKMVRQNQISRIKRSIKMQPILMSVLPGVLIVLLMMMFIVPLISNIIQQLSNV